MRWLLVALMGLSAAPAFGAAEIDMNTVTCQRYFSLPQASIATTWFWMDGQVHGTQATTVYDPAEVPARMQKLQETCASRPNDMVFAVFQELSK